MDITTAKRLYSMIKEWERTNVVPDNELREYTEERYGISTLLNLTFAAFDVYRALSDEYMSVLI